jgi:hypothetical protein
MKNIRAKKAIVATLVPAAVLLSSGVAGAVPTTPTTYAPATTTTSTLPSGIIFGDNNAGIQTLPVGQGRTYLVTNLKGGTSVVFSVNGLPGGSAIVLPDGTVVFTITVLDPHISVGGGPAIPASYGSNNVVLTGTLANGLPYSNSQTVIIPNPGGVVATASSTTSTGGLAFTGTDIAAMTIGGLALVAAGGSLVLVARRRRHNSSTS